MKISAIVLLSVAALSACATATPPAEAGVQSISYARGPCFGACPVYRVTVNADGTGVFEGERFTAVEGQRQFTVSSEAWRAFVAKLAPYRPEGSEDITHGHPRCERVVTDMPSANVTWQDDGGADRLAFYYGCRDAQNEALARALDEAPGLLPIADYIGPRR